MKSLFFIISALGLVYLLVSSMDLSRFSVGPAQTVSPNHEFESVNVDLKIESLKKLRQDIEALTLSQNEIQQELVDVSLQNSRLKDVVQSLQRKVLVQPDDKSNTGPQALKSEAATPLMDAFSKKDAKEIGVENNKAPLLIAQTTQTESAQQKRMRQQAILRDLAQKRQLAAISTLQTESN